MCIFFRDLGRNAHVRDNAVCLMPYEICRTGVRILSIMHSRTYAYRVTGTTSAKSLLKGSRTGHSVKGCGMGPLLVLISPCFRENVVVTCKICSFLCCLDNLLQKKKIIVFFFENQISKWHSFEKKKATFGLLFTFFSHQGKVTKIPSARISLTYIHVFCSPYWLFCLTNCEKIRIYQVWFLFGVISGVDSYSCHFGTINK